MDEYRGRPIALLTKHGKERVIQARLIEPLGARLVHTDAYDTDLLGTFTREIPRLGTQLEAARRKAEIGMRLTGLPYGLASEGSFGPGPLGLGSWNVEIVVFLDRERGLEVVGTAQGPADAGCLRTAQWDALASFARRVGFPDQHLVVRPDDEHGPCIAKGVATWSELRLAFDLALAKAHTGHCCVEPDLRAFANPQRMERIGEAAADLYRRLTSHCPRCGLPGFGLHRQVPGLPCALCGAPTHLPRAAVWRCPGCRCEVEKPATSEPADPYYCPVCNP